MLFRSNIYALAELTNADYPALVPAGQTVDTISVPTVLAVFNWAPKTDRYARVARFVERMFEKWDQLQVDPFHPKWREINLTAEVPGWKRSPVAKNAPPFSWWIVRGPVGVKCQFPFDHNASSAHAATASSRKRSWRCDRSGSRTTLHSSQAAHPATSGALTRLAGSVAMP